MLMAHFQGLGRDGDKDRGDVTFRTKCGQLWVTALPTADPWRALYLRTDRTGWCQP